MPSAADKPVLHPFVLWGQKDQNLYLTVQLQGVAEPVIDLEDSRLKFVAKGHGCHGSALYQFEIDLYLPVQRRLSSWQVKDKCVEFHLLKESNEIWPRLTHSKEKKAWIKINFDHMQFSDDTDEEESAMPKWDSDLAGGGRGDEDDRLKKAVQEDMDKFFSLFRSPRRLYLFLYNMFQWVGYSYVFYVALLRYMRADSADQRRNAFAGVLPQLCMVQLTSVLEVAHAAVGWVRSGVLAALLQVFGRNMILFLLVLPHAQLQQLELVLWLAVTWCGVEIVRYPYYVLGIIGQEMPVVTWLRYTIWIPLYPLGFVLEGLVMLAALPRVSEERWYCLDMPNSLNFSFDFSVFLRCYMVAFLVGGYFLISHMYSQRKRKIGPSPRSSFSKWGLLPYLSRGSQKRALGLQAGKDVSKVS